jgi:isopenicillin N synthase-like dioxygenase
MRVLSPRSTTTLTPAPPTCRYKAAGANATDERGSPDTVEFINIAQDDALAYPRIVHRAYPRTVETRMERTVAPFVRASMRVNAALMRALGRRLGLPDGALARRHAAGEPSGSEARCIKKPPARAGDGAEQVAIGGHTDFGSLSFLHNRLGGLQVLVPGTDEWRYVKVRCLVGMDGPVKLRVRTDSQCRGMRSATSEMRWPCSAGAY